MKKRTAHREPYLLRKGKDFSINYVRYAESDEYTCDLHFHDVHEFILFERVSGTYFCNQGASTVQTGDVVFTHAMETHDFDVVQGVKSWFVIQLSSDLLADMQAQTKKKPLLESMHLRPHLHLQADLFSLVKIFYHQCNENNNTLQQHLLQSIVGFIIGHSTNVNSTTLSSNTEKKSHGKLTPLVTLLKTSPTSLPTMKQAAKICYLSDAYCSKLFKQVFGQTYSAFVIQHKVQVGARLLSQTDYSVTEVAYELGFSTPSYFVAQFKRVMLITPKQFKKQLIHSD